MTKDPSITQEIPRILLFKSFVTDFNYLFIWWCCRVYKFLVFQTDQTHAHCRGNLEYQLLGHQGSSPKHFRSSVSGAREKPKYIFLLYHREFAKCWLVGASYPFQYVWKFISTKTLTSSFFVFSWRSVVETALCTIIYTCISLQKSLKISLLKIHIEFIFWFVLCRLLMRQLNFLAFSRFEAMYKLYFK